jgi:hypothetical protein
MVIVASLGLIVSNSLCHRPRSGNGILLERSINQIWRSASQIALLEGASPASPEICRLLAILEVCLALDQFQRLLPDFFILHCIINIAETLQDVIADQGAVLLRDSLREATGESVHDQLLLFLPRHAHFPQRLHTMSCCDKAFILRDRQQGGKILLHPVNRIALGEVAKNLRGDGGGWSDLP